MAKFQKGQSGNPGGRPAILRELRDLARAHTADALKTLVEVAGDGSVSPSARVAAANALLDRGWGRPMQAVTVESGEPGKRSIYEYTDAELMAILVEAGHPPKALERPE